MQDTEDNFLGIASQATEDNYTSIEEVRPIFELLHDGEQREYIILDDPSFINGTKVALTTDTMAIILEKQRGQWVYKGRYVILTDRKGAKIKVDTEGSGTALNRIGCDIVKIGGHSDPRIALTKRAIIVSGNEALARGQEKGIVQMDFDFRGKKLIDLPGHLFSSLRIDDENIPEGLIDFQRQNIYHAVVQFPNRFLPSAKP